MKLGYDNIEDAKSKLIGTFAYYKGKAFSIKNVYYPEGDPKKFLVTGAHLCTRTNVAEVHIDDPDLNCQDYNIGYANGNGLASWWYRNPQKQYQQGLRYNQVTQRSTNAACFAMEFKHGTPVGKMLENDYPTSKKVSDYLKAGEAAMMAFNRNFAMSRDKVHKDFLVEYKGQQIGFTEDLKDFKLLQEHEHLLEALKEAIG